MAIRPTLHLLFAVAGLPLLGSPASAQQVRNPGFEELADSSGVAPASWTVGGQGYEVALDSLEHHGGSRSLRMRRLEAGRLGVATQTVHASGFHGQLVRLSGYIKTEAVTEGYAGLWLRIDGADGTMFLDNMAGRGAVGTTDWTHFEVDGIVEPGAERMVFGAMLPGGGTAWFDDLALEAIRLETLPPPSDSALAYLNRALDLMQRGSIRRDSVDWTALRTSAVQRANGAEDPEGTYLAIRTALRSLGDNHSFFMEPKAVEAWRNRDAGEASGGDGPAAEVLEERFGYVLVPAFGGGGGDALREFAQRIQDLLTRVDEANPCGWVVDLRTNGGGNMWPTLAGLGPLLGQGDVGYFVNPDGSRVSWGYADGASRAAGRVLVKVPEPYVVRSGAPPIAVLTGSRTASSGEAIVAAFRARPDTRSFGEGTAGVSTSNASIELSDGAMMMLTTSVFADRTGTTYGKVIVPDEVITNPSEGTPLTEDPVVLRAIEWLGEHLRCSGKTR